MTSTLDPDLLELALALPIARRPRLPPLGPPSPPLAECERYTRELARTHYENFQVASRLLPRTLRQHFYNVYAYCRWADDLGDELPSPAQSLALLDWWEDELQAAYAGRTHHAVFVALRPTIDEFAIEPQPLADLLRAFRQDQTVTRYASVESLLDYCRYSANPVGRLVLHLLRAHDERRGAWSDSICTGLQLANFCQDVARDWARGRVYLPLSTLEAAGCGVRDLDQPSASPALRRAIQIEVDRAEELLRAGLPLVDEVPRWARADIWLFAHGGLRILEKVRELDYDVLSMRPQVTRWDQLRLLGGWLARRTHVA